MEKKTKWKDGHAEDLDKLQSLEQQNSVFGKKFFFLLHLLFFWKTNSSFYKGLSTFKMLITAMHLGD